jgi:hypothetical protein
LCSYLSKLNKEIKTNQRHQRGATTQIFHIRFVLVYLRLLKGEKSDSSIFSMIIFGFLLFSCYFLGYYYLFGSIVSRLHISSPKGGPLVFL